MNSKYVASLLLIFGLLFTLVQCGRLTERGQDSNDDGDNANTYTGDDSNDDDNDLQSMKNKMTLFRWNFELSDEKRAILNFLQTEDDASQFLDQSRRFLSGDQKSHMKEAKKK